MTMRPAVFAIAAALAGIATMFALSVTSTYATNYSGNVTINEAQALTTCNPNPAPAGGGGSATVTYDSNTNLLTWDITFMNLSGPAVAAHFHGPANPGVDAGIQVPIGDLTSPSQGSANITAGQETDLLAGLYYINYHTTACGGGEIRGQVNLTAVSVGGITLLPGVAGSSGTSAGLIAGLSALAASAAALVGAAWYAKRRPAL